MFIWLKLEPVSAAVAIWLTATSSACPAPSSCWCTPVSTSGVHTLADIQTVLPWRLTAVARRRSSVHDSEWPKMTSPSMALSSSSSFWPASRTRTSLGLSHRFYNNSSVWLDGAIHLHIVFQYPLYFYVLTVPYMPSMLPNRQFTQLSILHEPKFKCYRHGVGVG